MTTCKVRDLRIRQPRDAIELRRLSDAGRWVLADGQPARAFSGKSKDETPIAFYPDGCDCFFDVRDCPRERVMKETSFRYGCANGRPMRAVK